MGAIPSFKEGVERFQQFLRTGGHEGAVVWAFRENFYSTSSVRTWIRWPLPDTNAGRESLFRGPDNIFVWFVCDTIATKERFRSGALFAATKRLRVMAVEDGWEATLRARRTSRAVGDGSTSSGNRWLPNQPVQADGRVGRGAPSRARR
jgi:hypothetical protein